MIFLRHAFFHIPLDAQHGLDVVHLYIVSGAFLKMLRFD